MKPSPVYLSLLLLLRLPAHAGAQEAAVAATVNAMISAWKAADYPAFVSYFDPRARGFFLDGGPLVGTFDAATLEAAHEAGFGADLDLRDLDVKLAGDAAVSVAYLDGALTLPGGGRIEGTWRYSETRVLSDGTWKVIQFHFSQQRPPAG